MDGARGAGAVAGDLQPDIGIALERGQVRGKRHARGRLAGAVLAARSRRWPRGRSAARRAARSPRAGSGGWRGWPRARSTAPGNPRPCGWRHRIAAPKRASSASTTSVLAAASRLMTPPGQAGVVTAMRCARRASRRGFGVEGGRAPSPMWIDSGRRSAPIFCLQQHQRIHQRLGPRRAAGNIDIDRQEAVDALHHRIDVVHAARIGAGAHGDHPARFAHLLVKPLQRHRHLAEHRARHDQQVGLARRRADHLGAEAGLIVDRRQRRRHFDVAARQAEVERPETVLARPGDQIVKPREQLAQRHVVAGRLLVAGA